MKSLEEWFTLRESRQKGGPKGTKNNGKRTREEELAYGKDSSFNFEFKCNGFTVVPGIHGPSQAKDRRPDMSKDDWKRLHRKVLWCLKQKRLTRGTFLFYNKELEQGYIATLMKGGKTVRIITVLPRGKHNPQGGNGGTELEIVEQIKENLLSEAVLFDVKMIETLYI